MPPMQGSNGGSMGHYQLGLRILVMLVSEMNQPTPGRTLTAHRKVRSLVVLHVETLLQTDRHDRLPCATTKPAAYAKAPVLDRSTGGMPPLA